VIPAESVYCPKSPTARLPIAHTDLGFNSNYKHANANHDFVAGCATIYLLTKENALHSGANLRKYDNEALPTGSCSFGAHFRLLGVQQSAAAAFNW